jgi:hypothetical protein
VSCVHTGSYHLNLASITFSAISTTTHLLLISSFHNVSDQLSFISSYILRVHTISTLLPSPSLQCLPPHIFFRSLPSLLSFRRASRIISNSHRQATTFRIIINMERHVSKNYLTLIISYHIVPYIEVCY